MRHVLTMLVMMVGVGGVLAQAPSPPAQVAQLTMTEKVALQSIAEKLKLVNEQMKAAREALVEVEGEIAKNHPGYKLDESNGTLVPIVATPPTPIKK